MNAIMTVCIGLVVLLLIGFSVVLAILNDVFKKLVEIDKKVDTTQWLVKDVVGSIDIAQDSIYRVEDAVKDVLDELCEEDEEEDLEDDEDLDIHMITKEEFYFDNEFDTAHLIYDEQSGVVYYDGMSDIVFNDYPVLIGDGLRYFGVNGKDPNVIYIRNHKLGCDFEVTRVYPKKEDADGN